MLHIDVSDVGGKKVICTYSVGCFCMVFVFRVFHVGTRTVFIGKLDCIQNDILYRGVPGLWSRFGLYSHCVVICTLIRRCKFVRTSANRTFLGI
jgi:hypothetical protein